eukprot:3534260-Alexandrium_andersonii.AAC.1
MLARSPFNVNGSTPPDLTDVHALDIVTASPRSSGPMPTTEINACVISAQVACSKASSASAVRRVP